MLKLVKTRNKAKDVGPEDNTQAWNIKQEIQDDQSIKWLDTDLEEAEKDIWWQGSKSRQNNYAENGRESRKA